MMDMSEQRRRFLEGKSRHIVRSQAAQCHVSKQNDPYPQLLHLVAEFLCQLLALLPLLEGVRQRGERS